MSAGSPAMGAAPSRSTARNPLALKTRSRRPTIRPARRDRSDELRHGGGRSSGRRHADRGQRRTLFLTSSGHRSVCGACPHRAKVGATPGRVAQLETRASTIRTRESADSSTDRQWVGGVEEADASGEISRHDEGRGAMWPNRIKSKPIGAFRGPARSSSHLGAAETVDQHAYHLVSSGMSPAIAGRLLGRTDPSTTQRHSHLADDPLREASETMGRDVADRKR